MLSFFLLEVYHILLLPTTIHFSAISLHVLIKLTFFLVCAKIQPKEMGMINNPDAVNALLEYGKNLGQNNIQECTKVQKIIEREPALFVLCCIADKNVDADIVWSIPDNIPQNIPCNSFADIEQISQKQWQEILDNVGYNRSKKVSQEYIAAIKYLRNKYDGHAERIWTESKSFAEIIVKFLEFQGVGKKIATMAANMLNRYQGVGKNFNDKHFMDISPDTHVKQIFNMLGFVDDDHKDNTDIIVYTARALNPDAPYLLDFPCFYIGKNFCKKRGTPRCGDCPVKAYCKKS